MGSLPKRPIRPCLAKPRRCPEGTSTGEPPAKHTSPPEFWQRAHNALSCVARRRATLASDLDRARWTLKHALRA